MRDSISQAPQQTLVQAQRAWIRYRDAFCALADDKQAPLTADTRERCLALHTMARAVDLQNIRHLMDRPRKPAG